MAEAKAVVREYLDLIWNRKDLSAIDRLVSPGYIQHARGVPPGRDGVRAFFAMVNSAFSEVTYAYDNLIGEGDRAAWHWVMGCKHTGAFQGLPATGRTVSINGLSIVRLEGGMLAEHWGEQDMFGLLQQLGVLPGG